jgi:glycosyltransferase involved in cell wall biosynthesis
MPHSVLHLSTEQGWRGGEAQTLALSRGLVARGHRSRIAAPPQSALLSRASAAGVETAVIAAHGEWDVAAARRVARQCAALGATVLHCHTAHAAGLGTLATLFGVRPAIVASRRVSFGLRHPFFGRLKYSWRIARVIAVSEAIRRSLIAQGLDARRVVTVHSGIDPGRFEAGDRPRGREALLSAAARGATGRESWPAEAWLIGTAGHLAAHKGIDLFLAAAGIAATALPRARFVVIGDGEERRDLEARARQLGLGERVLFAGFRDDMPDLLKALDLFVLASHAGEGSPAVLKEAMAAGAPVAATALDGVEEIIEDGRHGLLTPPGDAEALARAMRTLTEDALLRARLVAAAGERVRDFTLDRMVEHTEAVYDAIGAPA